MNLNGYSEGAAPAWSKAGGISQRRYEDLLKLTAGATAAAVVGVISWLRVNDHFTVVLAIVTVGLAACAWAAVARANVGERKKLRVAYHHWLMAETQIEAYDHAVCAYLVTTARLSEAGSGEDARIAEELFSSERLFSTSALTSLDTLRRCGRAQWELNERLRATERSLQRVRDMERRAGVREAVAKRALVYADGQIPASCIGVEAPALRQHVDDTVNAAMDGGRVYESNSAGVVLSEAARWSALAAPIKLTKELMELFDPVNAVEVPSRSDTAEPPAPSGDDASGAPPSVHS